jgi:hypothetical protein
MTLPFIYRFPGKSEYFDSSIPILKYTINKDFGTGDNRRHSIGLKSMIERSKKKLQRVVLIWGETGYLPPGMIKEGKANIETFEPN